MMSARTYFLQSMRGFRTRRAYIMHTTIRKTRGTFRAARYSLSLATESLRAASLLATVDILKKVVRNSSTSICIGGANTEKLQE